MFEIQLFQQRRLGKNSEKIVCPLAVFVEAPAVSVSESFLENSLDPMTTSTQSTSNFIASETHPRSTHTTASKTNDIDPELEHFPKEINTAHCTVHTTKNKNTFQPFLSLRGTSWNRLSSSSSRSLHAAAATRLLGSENSHGNPPLLAKATGWELLEDLQLPLPPCCDSRSTCSVCVRIISWKQFGPMTTKYR